MSAKKKAKSAKNADVRPEYYDVIRKPVITEKSTMSSEHGKFVFDVSDTASKKDIKSAVEALFGVSVLKVNTLVRKGKRKGFRGNYGMQSDKKKAIVTLADGEQIDFSAGVK